MGIRPPHGAVAAFRHDLIIVDWQFPYKMATILLAEDEKNIRDVIKDILEGESHSVHAVRDGNAALSSFRERRPDLMILDVMMPRKSGFKVCEEVRASDTAIPILFLTARNEEVDKVRGLSIGGDDYLTKPFGAQELIARVSALLRRAGLRQQEESRAKFSIAGHELDVLRLELKNLATGRVMKITPQDANVMRVFAENPGKVLSRDFLIDKAWGMRVGATTRTVDMAVLKMRKLLGAESRWIETVRSGGYKLRES